MAVLGTPLTITSQVSPVPGSVLNYTQVMFEHPSIAGAEQYTIQVAEDTAAANFEHPFITSIDSAPAVIINHLIPGTKYAWRYAGIISGKQLNWAGTYRFEIMYDSLYDGNRLKINVEQNNLGPNAPGLICLDHVNCIIDRTGQVVWFMHSTGAANQKPDPVRDLTLTPFGTITGIAYGHRILPYEWSLSGDVLWSAPEHDFIGTDSVGYYHHAFRRLDYYRYMAMGIKYVNHIGSEKVDDDILLELNRAGDVLWSWEAGKYFKPEDTNAPVTDPNLKEFRETGAHMNAFFNDEANGFVYAGFRNASRIIKIEKATGKVVNSWGQKMPSGEALQGDGFFMNQHDIQILKDGSMAVFNNGNRLNPYQEPSVVVFTPGTPAQPSTVILNYECNFNGVPEENKSGSGGSVNELPNGNLLVCMGSVNRVFELTRNKKVVWNITVEKRASETAGWKRAPLFRAHYTSSLYPCYFAIACNQNSVSQKNGSLTLRIFNVGSEPDSYVVKVKTSSGNVIKQLSSGVVDAHSFSILTAETNELISDKIEVTVTSNTNPGLARSVQLNVVP